MTTHATEFSRFTAWLSQQSGRADGIGDLVNDLRAATGCKTVLSFRQHLRWYGADGAVAALDRALDEFRAAMRSPPEAV